MSMTTAIKTKAGKTHRFITQEYIVGLYVAVYADGTSIPNQFCVQAPEREFHERLRQEAPKKRDTVIKDESDPLNMKEVREDQITFAGEWCWEHGWLLSEDDNDWFKLLTSEQVKEIRAQPGWEACKAKLVW